MPGCRIVAMVAGEHGHSNGDGRISRDFYHVGYGAKDNLPAATSDKLVAKAGRSQ